MTICFNVTAEPASHGTNPLTHRCCLEQGEAFHGHHRCSCGYQWAAPPIALRPLVPSRVKDLVDLFVGDVTSCADDLEAVLTQLHEAKRGVDGEQRETLLHAIDKTQAAWAAAAEARTALRSVTL